MNNNNQMQPVNITPEINEAFQPAVLDVIRQSLAKNATDAEFILFAHKAAAYGLDPFKNEIFFIKYGNTARIQFAAEAYLSKARTKDGFQPPNTQMVHDNDEFKVGINPETKNLEVLQHEIGFPRGEIIGAYCIASRDGYQPVTIIMDRSEISHMFTGQNKDNWNKWTSDMFGKHVQQRALKKQYGLEFEDVTIQPDEQPQEPRDITPKEKTIEHKATATDPTTETDPAENESKSLKGEINSLFSQLGITTKEGVAEWLSNYTPELEPAKATVQELKSLILLLNTNIEQSELDEDKLL